MNFDKKSKFQEICLCVCVCVCVCVSDGGGGDRGEGGGCRLEEGVQVRRGGRVRDMVRRGVGGEFRAISLKSDRMYHPYSTKSSSRFSG